MVEKTKTSKYYDKIKYIIGRKTEKKGKTAGSICSSRSSSSCAPSYETPDILDISTDDSGIILSKDTAPSLPPKSIIITEAIVEPQQPGLWNSTPNCESRRPFKHCNLTKVSHNLNDLDKPVLPAKRLQGSMKRQKGYETEEIITSVMYDTEATEEQSVQNNKQSIDTDNDNFIRSVSTPKCKNRKPFKHCNPTKVRQSINESVEGCKPVEASKHLEGETKLQKEYETQEIITSVMYDTETTEGLSKYDQITEDLSVQYRNQSNTTDSDNFVRSVDEKFVVNLFESRQSNRWKRKSVCVDNFDKSVNIIDNGMNVGGPEVIDGCKNNVNSDSESDAMFYKLKKMRDAECVKMKEASNALRAIKKKNDREWSEELLTEKILLETDLKYKIIVNKIRDLKYSDWRITEPKHSATITLSNFQYELAQKPLKDSKYSEFFVLALSHDTDVFTTKVTAAADDKLVFNETFTLRNLDEDFSIRAEVFSIKLRTSKPRMITALLKKKSQNLCPIFRIYYENINTLEVQESAVLKSSFTSCGAFVITKNQITQNKNTGHIAHQPSDSRLQNNVTFTTTVDLNLAAKLSGFLTLGKADEQNNIVFWERKWCSLNSTLFSIYNYPQDEEFSKPPESSINLEYCFEPLIRPDNFPKRNSFILKTGRPSTINDSNNVILRRRNNFVLEKYYLYADSKEEFKRWTVELDSVLACLKEWDRLIFVDEYY
ncbi:unnamed protein product [Phaedon cochleariae]|uniref:PH domain-containing protein n=1 Tax=Phaedon cochleariae TaxID=80249 RepID=A0A9N9SGF9_PHACE|nr:unnamed protein product [Phaedon cochleariae]